MSSAESPGKGGERPLDYVLVRHMARSPRTRTLRAARSGHRRQGVLLEDGTRIRKKGKKRFTEMGLDALKANKDQVLEFVEVGALEVCDPVTEQALSADELLALLGEAAPAAPKPKAAPEPEKPPVVEPEEEKKGYTEEDLLNMGFDDLKHLAVNVFGVPAEGVKKLRAKQAVVDLIMEVATSASEE